MFKAVIFDYGHVVSAAPGMQMRRHIAEAFGVDEDLVGASIGKLIGDFRKGLISEETFWQHMAEDLSRPLPDNVDQLWREPFSNRLVIFDDVLQFVRNLPSKGVKTAVLSNNIQPWVDIIRECGGYNDFDVVINSCEVGMSKPDVEIYQYALDRLNVKPEEVVFVDDREENLKPARELGMQATLVTEDTGVVASLTEKLGM